jgi:hypothetical protein
MMTPSRFVEVVGDAAGQLADRLHLLRLAELGFHLLFVCDVLGEGEQECLVFTRCTQLGQADADPCNVAAAGEAACFDDMTRVGCSSDRIDQQFAVIDVRDVRNAHPDHFVGVVITKHSAECRVRLNDKLAVRSRQQHAKGAFLEDAAEPKFALLERPGMRIG